jgi:hypothetical protein
LCSHDGTTKQRTIVQRCCGIASPTPSRAQQGPRPYPALPPAECTRERRPPHCRQRQATDIHTAESSRKHDLSSLLILDVRRLLEHLARPQADAVLDLERLSRLASSVLSGELLSSEMPECCAAERRSEYAPLTLGPCTRAPERTFGLGLSLNVGGPAPRSTS